MNKSFNLPLLVILALMALALHALGGPVELTSNDGRSLKVTLISKDDNSVTVTREDGKEIKIKLDLLDNESSRLVESWTSPRRALFEQLNRDYCFVFRDTGKKQKSLSMYMDMCKEYGRYDDVGIGGLPEGKMSIASLFFAMKDRKFTRQSAAVLIVRYTKYSAQINEGNEYISVNPSYSDDHVYAIAEEFGRIAEKWPKELNEYALNDFRMLQSETLELVKEIESRDRSFDQRTSYYISEGVRKYNNRICSLIKEFRSELNQ